MDDKETMKEKSKPVGIIPTNYAKSHRINSDISHKAHQSVKAKVPTRTAHENAASISEETPGSAAHKVLDSDESDKNITPKKKKRRNKEKETEENVQDIQSSVLDPQTAATKTLIEEDNVPGEDPKPRIVLTFRSEKTGLRSSNMKIVSPEERVANEEAATRRSTRLLGQPDKKELNLVPFEIDDPGDTTYSPTRSWSPPAPKRSTRTRSKILGGEFSENVLANAIARKEKFYNETTPAQRLITRRIKPTAKVLANKELKLSVDTANSARLGSEKSPEEGIQTRRSARKQTPESRSTGETLKSQVTKKSKLPKSMEDSDDEVPPPGERYLSVDDIKQRMLSGYAPERKASLRADNKSSHDRENRRFNKLKKKHLSKLGLQAVAGVNVNLSNENLTDDSTMDSTNTDAIVEHLNAQKKLLEAQRKVHVQEGVDPEEDIEVDNEEQEEEEDEDSEVLSILMKEQLEEKSVLKNSETETSDDEFEYQCRAKPAVGAATPRFIRKRARLQRVDDSRNSEHSDLEQNDFSPAGGEEGSAAAAPGESAGCIAACLCAEPSNVYISPDALDEPVFCRTVELVGGARVGCSHEAARDVDGSLAPLRRPGVRVPYFLACALHTAQLRHHLCCPACGLIYIVRNAEPVFCRAVELVAGARVGCSHEAARDADGSLAPLRRPGVRVPYFLACALHTAQLRRHLCCPACGLFCTQGTFYQCSLGHLFHAECGVWGAGGGGAPADEPGCPHCGEGEGREGRDPLNRACSRVRVRSARTNRQIFLPDQRLQCTPAQMGFPSGEEEVEKEAVVPAALLPPAPVSLHSLRQRGDAAADYEELLTSSAEERLAHAIAVRALPDHILTKLISGVDLHQSLELAEGGTFLHLAAKHGNLAAVYLLHYAGCRLDLPDAHLHTPLMVAVLALVEKPPPPPPPAADGKKETVEQKREPAAKSAGRKTLKEILRDSQSFENRAEVEKGILQVIRYLVAAGCDINYQGAEGVTALHLAAQHGGRDACAALLDSRRVNVDARDLGGWSPLVWAAENKHPGVVRLLLRQGADACSTDGEGNSVLHWCALAGCAASLHLLLDAASPAAVDTLNPHGDTPLHVAAREDHYPCVAILLARGGRTDLRNTSRELAVECARGDARTAISLNMQMSLAMRDRPVRHKLLSGDISRGRELLPVSCVNEVDETPLPSDFTYVTRHVYPQYVRLHNTLASMQGCECATEACGAAGGAEGAACACCALGVRRWYSEGRLVPNFPFRDAPMLFECNETCKCNLRECPNAVVTRLSVRGATFVRVQVFRCGEARGWGLRALAAVPRGAPVALYCGELLSAAAADTRARDHYMFAMEVKRDLLEQCEDATALCVDAGAYGSAARFINHSCRANLAPVRVFTRERDVRAPDIVLFAARDIPPMEELTFNYGDKFWSVKSKFMHCRCGAPDCRYAPRAAPADR